MMGFLLYLSICLTAEQVSQIQEGGRRGSCLSLLLSNGLMLGQRYSVEHLIRNSKALGCLQLWMKAALLTL